MNSLPLTHLLPNPVDDDGKAIFLIRPGEDVNLRKCSVAAMLEDRYIEVLIFENDDNGKAIRLFKYAESTPSYHTQNDYRVETRPSDGHVKLTVKKTNPNENWREWIQSARQRQA